MKNITFLVCLFTVLLITVSFSFFKKDYADRACDIRSRVGKQLAKKYRMQVIGSGGGFMDTVNEVFISFELRRVLDKDEARCLIVDCVETMLKAYNEDEKIRPDLLNFPFTTKNIEISIYLSTPAGYDIYAPQISTVAVFTSNEVSYITRDKKGNRVKTTEPYAEALAKVREGPCAACNLGS